MFSREQTTIALTTDANGNIYEPYVVWKKIKNVPKK